MAASASLVDVAGRFFPRVVPIRSSRADQFPKTLLSPFRSPSPSPAITSLRLSPRQTADYRRRMQPVLKAQAYLPPQSELVFDPHRFGEVLAIMETLPDVRARCRQIVRYGLQLLHIPTCYITDANRVEGLPESYDTYIHATLDPGNSSLVHFYARSDAPHIKGLLTILVGGLTGSPVHTIADMPLEPFSLLIARTLLPARWCAQFVLLLEHMQRKARELINTGAGAGAGARADARGSDRNIPGCGDLDDILSIRGLGFYKNMEELIDQTNVLNEIGCSINVDGEEEELQEVEDFGYGISRDDADDAAAGDGLSWRVKRIEPQHMEFYLLEDEEQLPFRL